MKIGIDARMLSPNFGIGRYIQQLILHLEQIDTENEYIIFLRQENFENLKLKNINFKKILADIPWYTMEEQKDFLKILNQNPVDLMHFPHWNVPYFYKGPFIVTIHDLTMYHHSRPEATTLGHMKFWLKDQAHRTLIKHVVKEAKNIIVTSQFTANDLSLTLGVPKEKMFVTYQAPFKAENINESANILEKWGINKKFVLYVGAAYPHKNLDRLLEAWKVFIDEKNDQYELVLVGKDSYFYQKLKEKFGSIPNVIFTGLVEDTDLVEIYKKASAFVFPSLYEGFGLPPLEAAQYNVPLLVSSATCLPEVLGEGALYFDPENIKQLVDSLDLILHDENIRQELKYQARENLNRFSWKKLAVLTQNIYKKSL